MSAELVARGFFAVQQSKKINTLYVILRSTKLILISLSKKPQGTYHGVHKHAITCAWVWLNFPVLYSNLSVTHRMPHDSTTVCTNRYPGVGTLCWHIIKRNEYGKGFALIIQREADPCRGPSAHNTLSLLKWVTEWVSEYLGISVGLGHVPVSWRRKTD